MGKGWDMTMGEGYINSGISVDGHVVRIASTVTSTFASAGMDMLQGLVQAGAHCTMLSEVIVVRLWVQSGIHLGSTLT